MLLRRADTKVRRAGGLLDEMVWGQAGHWIGQDAAGLRPSWFGGKLVFGRLGFGASWF